MRYFALILPIFLYHSSSYAQAAVPDDMDILLEEPVVGETLGSSGSSNTDSPTREDMNSPTTNEKEEVRSVKEIMEGDLIQVDPKKNQEAKKDPYPLMNYKGSFLNTIDEIQKQYKMKNIEQVKASLEKMKEAPTPMDPIGDLLLGNVYSELQLYTKAIESFDTGIKKIKDKEQQVIFQLNKAQTLRHWNKNQEAMKILEKIDTDEYGKKYPQIFFYSGLSSLYLNNAKKAIFFLRKYLELNPKAPQAVNIKRAIAWLLFTLNKGSGGGSGGGQSGGGSGGYDEDEAKRLLESLENQENSLSQSLNTSVDDRDLDIENKGIEEGEEYSSIAD